MKRILFSVLKNIDLEELQKLESDSDEINTPNMEKEKKSKGVLWTNEEDKLLIKLTKKNTRNKWIEISKNFTNKSPSLCQLRYLKINPIIKKGRWNHDEDLKLLNLINQFGLSWTFISKFFKNRNPKQIRSRYINNLCNEKNYDENKVNNHSIIDNNKKRYYDTSVSENINTTSININVNFNTIGNNKNIQLNEFDINSFFNFENYSN